MKGLFNIISLVVLLSLSANAGVVRRPVTGLSKSGSAVLKGDVTLSEGSGVTLTQSGQDISIAATATGSTVLNFTVQPRSYSVPTTYRIVYMECGDYQDCTATLFNCDANDGAFVSIKNGGTQTALITQDGNDEFDKSGTTITALPGDAWPLHCQGGYFHVIY